MITAFRDHFRPIEIKAGQMLLEWFGLCTNGIINTYIQLNKSVNSYINISINNNSGSA